LYVCIFGPYYLGEVFKSALVLVRVPSSWGRKEGRQAGKQAGRKEGRQGRKEGRQVGRKKGR
jgi:hypothetical protein